MIASALMTTVVPKVAGRRARRRLRAAAPAAGIAPAMLYAMHLGGADQILCLGGVQALAALAFGIEDVAPVDMIVGAGNAYVAEAKRQLFGKVGIDLLAGPTEILVIADEHRRPRAGRRRPARPARARPDLAGGPDHDLAQRSARRRSRRSSACSRAGRPREVAGEAWRAHGAVVVVRRPRRGGRARRRDRPRAPRGPVTARARLATSTSCATTGRCSSASRRPSPTATRAIGTNHVLPTAGAARYTGGCGSASSSRPAPTSG